MEKYRFFTLVSVILGSSVTQAAVQNCSASFTDCNGVASNITSTCSGCTPIVADGICYNNVVKRGNPPNQCIVSVSISCIDCPENGPPPPSEL